LSKRPHISLKTKLAAAICCLLKIPHEHAEAMHEEHVLSLVDWDHYPIPKAHGGPDAHFNLVPRPKLEHRLKTAKIDVPQIAKTKRIEADNIRHQAIIAAKAGIANNDLGAVLDGLAPVAKKQWPKQKIASRPFNSKGKRRVG
jgi:hypothetical protein